MAYIEIVWEIADTVKRHLVCVFCIFVRGLFYSLGD